MIDFGRPSHGLIADPVVDREITAQVPLVTRKELRFPIAKAAPRITNPRREAAGDTHPKVRDRVPAEIVAKINHTALAAGFVTVDLAPDEFPAKTPCVLAANLLHPACIVKTVLRPVDGNVRPGPQRIEHRAEGNRWPDRVRLRHDQRAQAIKIGGNISDGGTTPVPVPCHARRVRFRGRIRILPGNQLEGVHCLRREQILKREPVAHLQALVQAARRIVGVDALRRIRVEHALVDVDAVR